MLTHAPSTVPSRRDSADRRVDGRKSVPTATVPEDSALYVCECGEGFTAAVTTCVTCPSCGHGQAW